MILPRGYQKYLDHVTSDWVPIPPEDLEQLRTILEVLYELSTKLCPSVCQKGWDCTTKQCPIWDLAHKMDHAHEYLLSIVE